MVVAGSVNETYKRNALNNGLLVVECEPLVKIVKEAHSTRGPRSAIVDPAPIKVDLVNSVIEW